MYTNNTRGDICGAVPAQAVPSGRWNVGDKIGVAVDTINGKFWSRNWTVTNGQSMTTTAAWEPATGNPQTGSGGWDISTLPGNLFIWWGAPGVFLDTVILNSGFTTFYGIDGTGVIPAGYTAWDATAATKWDKSAALGTALDGLYRDQASINPPASTTLRVNVDGLTASIITRSSNFTNDNQYGTTWIVGLSYVATTTGSSGLGGSIVMDGHSTDFPCAFYMTEPTYLNGFLPSPVQRTDWASLIAGVVSTTSKARV
jgi:hypothetical protein